MRTCRTSSTWPPRPTTRSRSRTRSRTPPVRGGRRSLQVRDGRGHGDARRLHRAARRAHGALDGVHDRPDRPGCDAGPVAADDGPHLRARAVGRRGRDRRCGGSAVQQAGRQLHRRLPRLPGGRRRAGGDYDREDGAWVGSLNGRVVRILGETGGQAQLEWTATDRPTAARSSPTRHRRRGARAPCVAVRAGKTLWRVPLLHFSPGDYNWPFGPGANAQARDPLKGLGGNTTDDCKQSAGQPDCQDQTAARPRQFRALTRL